MTGIVARWRRAVTAICLTAVLALAVGACGDDDENSPPPEGVVPDFSLKDVNPNSPTHDTNVSPRDFLGGVSAYYFGDAA